MSAISHRKKLFLVLSGALIGLLLILDPANWSITDSLVIFACISAIGVALYLDSHSKNPRYVPGEPRSKSGWPQYVMLLVVTIGLALLIRDCIKQKNTRLIAPSEKSSEQ